MSDWLVRFVGSGTALDWILGLVAAEAVLLLAYQRLTGTGLRPGTIFALLLPGACLLLAVRCALTNTGPFAVAALLFSAFLAHLADLAVRWRASVRGGALPSGR